MDTSVQGEGRDPTDPFDRRLDEARLRAGLDPDPAVRSAASRPEPHPLAYAFRMAVEMVVPVAVACAIGWGLDRWLGTRPWLMIAFLPIGVGAGVRTLMKTVAPSGPTGR